MEDLNTILAPNESPDATTNQNDWQQGCTTKFKLNTFWIQIAPLRDWRTPKRVPRTISKKFGPDQKLPAARPHRFHKTQAILYFSTRWYFLVLCDISKKGGRHFHGLADTSPKGVQYFQSIVRYFFYGSAILWSITWQSSKRCATLSGCAW